MSANIVNKVAYLRTSWEFPEEAKDLTVQLSRSFLDIANTVNSRTIGLHPTNKPAITGNEWFLDNNKKHQSLRQVYSVTGAGNIQHNLNLASIGGIVHIYGAFTNGTNWYPLPYVDAAAATNQVSVIVDSKNIVITTGGGAPSISSGFIVLEWLSQP